MDPSDCFLLQGSEAAGEEAQASVEQLRSEVQEWQEVFADVDACVEPVLTIEEAAGHPQLKARGMVVDRDRGDGHSQNQLGHPILFR